MKRSIIAWLGLFTLVLAGCGTSTTAQTTAASNKASQNSNAPIMISGSSTVYPLTYRIAYATQTAGMDLPTKIENVGTGGGFRAFCADQQVDIVNASRPINVKEQSACNSIGRNPVAFQVGFDALTVAISTKNTFVDSLSIEQIERIFSGGAKTWQEVDSRYPAEPIEVYSPGNDSGTFDYFVEVVFTGDPTRLTSTAKRSEDDDVLVKGLEANPNAVAYFGYAYYQFNDDQLRAIPVRRSAQDSPVAPGDESVLNNTYPFVRPLFIYSDSNTIKAKPQVAAFIDFYLERVNAVIRDVGYFPEQRELILKSRQLLATLRRKRNHWIVSKKHTLKCVQNALERV